MATNSTRRLRHTYGLSAGKKISVCRHCFTMVAKDHDDTHGCTNCQPKEKVAQS